VTTDQLHLGVPRGPLSTSAGALARRSTSPARREALAAWLGAHWPVLAAVLLLGLLGDLLLGGAVTTVADPAVRAHVLALPHAPGDVSVALVLDRTGKITTVSTALLVASLWAARRERSWSPVVMAGSTLFVMLAVLAVVKFGLARGLAVNGDPSLFLPGGQAFPSGHGAQAALGSALVAALVARARGVRLRRSTALLAVLVPSAVMTSVSLYLGFHWMSDLVAGALVGALAARAGLAVEARVARRRAERQRIGIPPLALVQTPFDVREPCEAAATGVGGLSARRISVDRNPVAR